MLLSECFYFKYFQICNEKLIPGDKYNWQIECTISCDESIDISINTHSSLAVYKEENQLSFDEEIIKATANRRSSRKSENFDNELLYKIQESGLNFKDNPVSLSKLLFAAEETQSNLLDVPKIAKFQIHMNKENGFISILRGKFREDSIILDLILAAIDKYKNLKLEPHIKPDPRAFDLFADDLDDPGQPDFDFPPLNWNYPLKNLQFYESEFRFVLCEKVSLSSQSVGSKSRKTISKSLHSVVVSITDCTKVIVPLEVNKITYFRDLLNFLYANGNLHNLSYNYSFQISDKDRAILKLPSVNINMDEEVRNINKMILLRRKTYRFEEKMRVYTEVIKEKVENELDNEYPGSNLYENNEKSSLKLSFTPKIYKVSKRSRYGTKQTRLIKINEGNVEVSKPGNNSNQRKPVQIIREIKTINDKCDAFTATVVKDNEIYEQVFTCESTLECSLIIESVKNIITQ